MKLFAGSIGLCLAGYLISQGGSGAVLVSGIIFLVLLTVVLLRGGSLLGMVGVILVVLVLIVVNIHFSTNPVLFDTTPQYHSSHTYGEPVPTLLPRK